MLKTTITKGLLFATVLGATGGMVATPVFADEPSKANQNVKAVIEEGTFSGTINGGDSNGGTTPGNPTEPGQSIQAGDIDFGTIKIGDDIKSVTVKDMVQVTDHSGANGWKLQAKNTKANEDTTLQLFLNLTAGEGSNIATTTTGADKGLKLTGDALDVAIGVSQLEVAKADGTYGAEWGTQPKQGNYDNVVEWTLTRALGATE